MSKILIIGPGALLPPTFSYDPQLPTYHLEMLAWLQLKNIDAMQTAGMVCADVEELKKFSLPQAEGDSLKFSLAQAEGEKINIGLTTSAESPLWIQSVADVPEEIPDDLWTAQNDMLIRQSNYLESIKSTYGALYGQLPKDWSITNFLQSQEFGWLVSLGVDLLPDLPGPVDDLLVKKMITWGASKAAWGWEFLSRFFNDGGEFCIAMIEENNELLKLAKSRENYQMRIDALRQHDEAIQGLMQQAALAQDGAQMPSFVGESRPLAASLERLTQTVAQVGLLPPSEELSEKWKSLLGSFLDLLDGDQDGDGLPGDIDAEAEDIKRRASYLQLIYALLQQVGAKTTQTEDGEEMESYLKRIEDQLAQLSTGEKAILCPHTGACLYTRSLGKIK